MLQLYLCPIGWHLLLLLIVHLHHLICPIVYNLLGLLRLSIALGFKSHIIVILNHVLMFCLDSD
jgi:hypothetical protein